MKTKNEGDFLIFNIIEHVCYFLMTLIIGLNAGILIGNGFLRLISWFNVGELLTKIGEFLTF